MQAVRARGRDGITEGLDPDIGPGMMQTESTTRDVARADQKPASASRLV